MLFDTNYPFMKQEEAERLEKELQEQQEYDSWKSLISVEEKGTEKDESMLDEATLMQRLSEYMKREKIVLIEEMATHFVLRPDELAALIDKMQATKPPLIDGIFDREQGKFLYIPLEQRRKLADFIRQEGRVNLNALMWQAQNLIDLTPETDIQE
jgi:DDRGK domain-containing protein 1